MKKIFAIILSITILFPSINARAEVTDDATMVVTSNQSETMEVVEDGELTIEVLQQISSWDELKALLSFNNKENEEDLYCVMLLKGIDKTHIAPLYHDMEYVGIGLGGIDRKVIDQDRLMKKFQTIIDIYNKSNDLQLVWESKILNDSYMQVDVRSTNLNVLNNPAIELGDIVTVSDDAIYWESSWNDGSGNYGIIRQDNAYVPEDNTVIVNGVSYLGTENTVIESYYKPYNELTDNEVEIKFYERRMLHLCTPNGDLGWVYPEDVRRKND